MKFIICTRSIKTKKQVIIITNEKGGKMSMKFIKGMIVGTMVTTGVIMMWADAQGDKTLWRKGRKIARKWGMM